MSIQVVRELWCGDELTKLVEPHFMRLAPDVHDGAFRGLLGGDSVETRNKQMRSISPNMACGQSSLFDFSYLRGHEYSMSRLIDPPDMPSPTRSSASASAAAPASSRSDVSDEEVPSRVPRRACGKCTKSKRKCDKTSPTCGRCKRYAYSPAILPRL